MNKGDMNMREDSELGLIIHQKAVALELLHKLEGADPLAILAGGAPRDWYFNHCANDLDFYVHLPTTTLTFEEKRWERLGLDVKPLNHRTDRDAEQYKCMKHLHRIWEGTYKSVKFQIMVMNEPTPESVVPKFGASVCQVWWKGDDVVPTQDFILSHMFETIFRKDDYTAKEKHITKMQERYPHYKLDSVKNLDNYVRGYARKHNIFPTKGNVIKHFEENK